MQCTTCGTAAYPETTVTLTRSFRRTRAARRQGWYCWTCKSSFIPESGADYGTDAVPAHAAGRLSPAGRFAGWGLRNGAFC